ncbi:hypothetical protein IKB17_05225 [bacterium]|nr:hypothetical protein [bacterium]
MPINAIPSNLNNQNKYLNKNKIQNKSYLENNEIVKTDSNIHPLPPKGHLVNDNLSNSIKFFFEDIKYNIKSVKNGINGEANDHQLGRLNDVGIVTAGILIATYLASKTTNPKARIMEYVGLGTFLTAMSIYPKLVINMPAKLLHGYDIDKEFIDDQGRKKSVMQDSNYVPYDMYLGDVPEEDISIIGDKMGIPKDIKNRNDLIREQMRKIATQNNTLWMLTAGITPALTALLCCGLENFIIAPAIEKSNITRYNNSIAKALKNTSKMSDDISSIKSNMLSKKIETFLSKYKNQELPKEEFDKLLDMFSEGLFENTTEGIKDDLSRILNTSVTNGSQSVFVNDEILESILNDSKKKISKSNKDLLEKALIPSKEELSNIIKNHTSNANNIIRVENISIIRNELSKLIDSRIQTIKKVPKEFLLSQKNDILEYITNSLNSKKSFYVTDENIKKITDFAKILGEFKENKKILSNAKAFQVEHAQDTIIARSYDKFEKTLLKELDIKFSDLKKMRESEKYTKELLDKKFMEIAKDEARFKKTMERLGDVVSDLEVKLNGKSETNSNLLNLINAIENNYNKTAQRLSKLGSFDSTIDRLVKQDVSTLKNNLQSRTDLFDALDGITENKYKDLFNNGNDFWKLSEEKRIEYIKANANGVGSSKNLEISKIIERYQGAKNSFNRVLHTLDVYKRALSPEKFAKTLYGKSPEYVSDIIKKGKDTLLYASSSDHVLKLDTVNNPSFYKDLMNSVWTSDVGEFYSTKQKGYITDVTKESLSKNNSMAKGNVLDRFQFYITRFRNIVANNDIDFTKPNHILNPDIRNQYSKEGKTRMSFFNLVGQTPVDMARGAASRKFATQKWLRIISAITTSVFGITLLAQFGFGKISNPQNVQKKVSNDANK